jgi:TonB family protein
LGAGILLAGEVDEPVSVLVPARPVYPPALAAAGIAGEVRVEFVVDTAGRCEPGSVRTVSSTNPGFEAAARAAVCEAKYLPGRVARQAVRQLVQQKVAFRQSQ